VMIGLNIQTSFLTPPFGFALFYLRGVAPAAVKTLQIYKGVIAFILLQISALVVVGMLPQLVNYLPNRVSLLGETSPPPRNPKLQYCLDTYVAREIGASTAVQTVASMQSLDLSVLPKGLSKDLAKGFASAEAAISGLTQIAEAEVAVQEAAPAFRPKLAKVRRIERDIRAIEAEAKDLKKRFNRMRDETLADERAKLEAKYAGKLAEAEQLKSQIPASWSDEYKVFSALTGAEFKARQTYRRNADASYDSPAELLAILNGNEGFAALEDELRDLRSKIESVEQAEGIAMLQELERKFGEIEGSGDVKKGLGKARRAFKKKTPEIESGLKEFDKAIAAYEKQQEWRGPAADGLKVKLEAYLNDISGTLGARSQKKLNRDQALYLAGCTAKHRDLSLNF